MLRLVMACLLIGLVAAPAASAASTTQILRDCADDGVLQGHYSPSELRKARQHIPTDADEYTDCRDVLSRATAGAIAGGGSGSGGASGSSSGGGGSFASPVDTNTQEARDAVGKAAAAGPPGPIDIGGRPVVAGTAGLAADAVRNGLPTSMIVVLALLAASALAAVSPFLRRSVLARFKR